MNQNQSQNCSVLLIDDEAMAEDLIGYHMARQQGITLRYDNRAELAVQLCKEVEATVLLVDLRMPGADGFDVIRMLRADPYTEHLPVILLSSEDDADIKAQAFALGANDYLVNGRRRASWKRASATTAPPTRHASSATPPSWSCASARRNCGSARPPCTRRRKWKRSAN